MGNNPVADGNFDNDHCDNLKFHTLATVLWDVMVVCSVWKYQRFDETCRLHPQRRRRTPVRKKPHGVIT
jgi:hypothetical protein